MDIDEIRDIQIKLHGLAKVDNSYTFYHDETNNTRKLHVGAQGLNVDTLKVFVLGGIVHEGASRPIDIQPLRNAMHIQKTATEIKLEHIAKGEFLDLLRSTKLTIFLRWIIDNGLMIHYHDLDPFFWSIVDIIDSVLIGNRQMLQYHMLLKSDLAAVLRNDLSATIKLFHRYNYPGLAPKDRAPFLNDLITLAKSNSATLPTFNAMMLKGVLQAGRSLDSLEFIEGFTANLLIDDFSVFYLNRLAVFTNATHILDMEEAIRARFLKTPLTRGGQPVTHYRFADSKTETGIQLSDIVVGVLGKMYSYFTKTPRNGVAAARANLTGSSLQNTELLRDLIAISDPANIAFLHHVASIHDIDKFNLFLRFRDGSYAD